ncbi:MAG: hypothetical protein JXA10_18010, partial [Anaerolineae bacterium]|nr:hypothetical protein [Anaerolineae bacterium]
MSIKQQILDLLDFAQREEQALIDSLTEEERTLAGSLEHWSAKDMLTHLYAWKVRFIKNLEQLRSGSIPLPVNDIDQENAAIYQTHH